MDQSFHRWRQSSCAYRETDRENQSSCLLHVPSNVSPMEEISDTSPPMLPKDILKAH
jgi:hypothetical protein